MRLSKEKNRSTEEAPMDDHQIIMTLESSEHPPRIYSKGGKKGKKDV